jgi:toxin ParE1/3/4
LEKVRPVRLRYAPQALRHLDTIAEYIGARNPDAARRVGSRIQEIIDLLVKFPNMGHKGKLPGTREMGVPGLPYIIVYRIENREGGELVILGVYHGAQRQPGQQ